MKESTDPCIADEVAARTIKAALDDEWWTLDRLLRAVPVSGSTIYRKVSAGEFPAPVKFGGRSLWRKSQVLVCMANPSSYRTPPF